ncbi:glycosyltransferase family 4 protein [Chitinimonas sp.]|uniref:glycosyltransferase family 4 protein n=1 Tax=Chitinimonas sp. TaxID=1934313 RepID=UPI002F93E815
MHGWGGGQQVWVEDFCEADTQHVHLLLAPVGGHATGIFSEIAVRMPGREEPLYRWHFNAPIRATAIHHPEYRAALAMLCRVFMVDGILVSSLIGHALDVLDTPLPTLHVCHEYYPFCPAFYIRYQGICQRCDDARLKDCLSNNPASSLFSHVSGATWSAIRQAYLRLIAAKPIRLLAPSESVARYYRQLQPAIAEHGITVIPHGMDWLPAGAVAVTRPAGSLPRIVILGRLYEAKGKALLDELLPRICTAAEVVLLGCGYGGREYDGLPNVILVPSYERTALPALLAEYRPDLGLLLSVVPETFSYTLSELMHAGIPALAPRLGSFVDRIVDGENGFLAEPTVEAMSARLEQLLAERSALTRVAGHLRAYRGSTRAEMVAAYLPLLPSRAMHAGFQPGSRWLPTLAETAPLEAQMGELDAAQCKQAALPRPNHLRGRLIAKLSAILIRIVYRLQRMAAGRS